MLQTVNTSGINLTAIILTILVKILLFTIKFLTQIMVLTTDGMLMINIIQAVTINQEILEPLITGKFTILNSIQLIIQMTQETTNITGTIQIAMKNLEDILHISMLQIMQDFRKKEKGIMAIIINICNLKPKLSRRVSQKLPAKQEKIQKARELSRKKSTKVFLITYSKTRKHITTGPIPMFNILS
jgi:hypothetical protein